MSLDALNWAMLVETGDVVRKAVLLVLAKFADEKGLSYPSLRTVCGAVELEKRAVQRRLGELVRLGLIQRAPRFRGRGQQTSNGYQLLMPQVEPVLAVVNPRAPRAGRVSLETSPQAKGGVPVDTPPRVPGDTPGVAGETPHEVGVEVGTTKNILPPTPRTTGEEVVSDLWKRLKPVIQRVWHQGDEVAWIEGEPCGMGLEKLHLGVLIAAHGSEATELAVLAARHVWPEGWPRTLAWYTSPTHGGGNFHEALSFARRNHARSTSRSEAATLAKLIPEVLTRLQA